MMESLINLILGEVAVALALVILLLLIIIWQLLKKHVVTVTVVTVKTEAASYDHGDAVKISGDVTVDETPQAGVPVSLKIVDETENEFGLPDATTDADGKFTAVWTIPPEVAPGVCTVSATALGTTAATTFRFKWETTLAPSRGNKKRKQIETTPSIAILDEALSFLLRLREFLK